MHKNFSHTFLGKLDMHMGNELIYLVDQNHTTSSVFVSLFFYFQAANINSFCLQN